ncbi:ABC transporter permease [Nocardioides cynanchi]|uniref:ABC transporter permease n=1 Tax=Nocardioides cynanchi TaxID=2558918 RepID=UPI0012441CA7|nr:ABC transporter permease subunit [Nocardioides cynanchi]
MTRSSAGRLAALAATAAIPLLVLGVFFVLPVGGMVSRGFVQHGRLDVGGALAVLGRPEIRRAIWFTLWSSLAGTVLSLLLGLPAAHVLHRLDFPGRTWLRALLVVPFVLPTVVVGVAFELLIGESGPLGGLGLDGSPVAIVAGLVFFNASLVIRVVGGAWESLDPRPAEAAAALGASPLRVLRDVTLPALRSAIVSAASVVFLFCATAFGIVLTLGGLRYSSVETQIYLLTNTLLDLQAAAALSILQLAVVVALLVAAARLRRTPDARVGRSRVRLRRASLADLPSLAATGVLLALVVAPLAGLVVGSLRVDGAWSLANYRALQTPGSHQALLVPVTTALMNSLRIAVDATWMSLLLGLTVAALVTRRSRGGGERRLRSVLDGLFMLPLGVSAVTLGFGFLITLGRPPLDLRDSPLLIPVAQALVALPLVVRVLVPVLSGIDDRLRQAAATLGASPSRALLVVDLPVVWKPLLAAAGFAFACSLGEFGATSFLVRDDRPTLPVVIYRLLSHPGDLNYGMALAAAVVLGASTALVMLLVERLRVPSVGTL